MSKSDLEKMKKYEEEYNKFFEDTPFGREIDKIARDIRERQDNAMAMEFTRTITELLRENGIVIHCTEHSYIKDSSDKSIEKVYGVIFDSVDCTEHDKPFKDEIAQLKKDLEKTEKKAGEKLKPTNEEPCMYIINMREIDGEKYIKYSDYEWYRKSRESRIRELEEIIKNDSYRSAKDILSENIELRKQVEELESELSVKENLLKIKNGIHQEKPRIHIIGLREFGEEQYMRFSDVEDLINELEG